MSLALSVLDLSPIPYGGTGAEALQNSVSLAEHAEQLGYQRFWLAEHHFMGGLAGVAPEVLIAAIAQRTKTIRLGSGGVLLPNYSPLKVAEVFRSLEALTPGRIDLGIGRAPRQDPRTALALRGSPDRLNATEEIARLLTELETYAETAESVFAPDHELYGVVASPQGVPLPPIFLLGSGQLSAQIAAERGYGFAAAHHFSPLESETAIRAYKTNFRPSKHSQSPYAILTVSAIAAESSELALGLAKAAQLSFLRRLSGHGDPMPSLEEALEYTFSEEELEKSHVFSAIHGTAHQVANQLSDLAVKYQADEIQISSLIANPAWRLRSYQLIAEAFALSPLPNGSLEQPFVYVS